MPDPVASSAKRPCPRPPGAGVATLANHEDEWPRAQSVAAAVPASAEMAAAGSSPRPTREPCVALIAVRARSQEPGRHSEGGVCLVRPARGGALPVTGGHTPLQARPLTPATQRPLRVLEEASG